MLLIRFFSGLLLAAGAGFGFLCSASDMVSGHSMMRLWLFGGSLRLPVYDWHGIFDFIARNGWEALDPFNRKLLVALACWAAGWLLAQSLLSRVMRLFANRKSVIHGSSRWATTRELRKAGLLKGTGLVLGQTDSARYVKKESRKPRKRSGESEWDYRARLDAWIPGKNVDALRRRGELITQNQKQHTLIIGSTRSGKGVSCIIPTEFRWPDSMIVLDPKGEGWEISANFRSRFSYTFKFEPEKPDESIHYNPLLSVRRGKQTIPDIQNLSYILIPDDARSQDPYWNDEGRRLFSAVCGYVVYCEPPERKNFATVYSFFSNSSVLENAPRSPDNEDVSAVKRYLMLYAENIKEYIARNRMPADAKAELSRQGGRETKDGRRLFDESRQYIDQDDEAALMRIRDDLVYFSSCEDKPLSSVISTMMSKLMVIADPNVQAVTDRSDFTFEDFVNGVMDADGHRHPISLYLCVSLSSMMRLVPLIKLFYEQAITLLTRELRNDRKYRLLLIFDEFRQLGKMDIVEKALALTAGYGIVCAIAIQSFDQLRVLYQSEAVFVDNFFYQVVLRVNDEGTSERIEKMLGQQTARRELTSFSGNMNQLTHKGENVSVQEYGRSLMTAEEIRTMDDNEILIIASGQHPYRGKKVRYYMDPRFTRLYMRNGAKLPPPALAPSEDGEEGNYPHPGSLATGVDLEGWVKLRGIGTDAGAEEPGAAVPSPADYISDSSKPPRRRREASRLAPEIEEPQAGGLRSAEEILRAWQRHRAVELRNYKDAVSEGAEDEDEQKA